MHIFTQFEPLNKTKVFFFPLLDYELHILTILNYISHKSLINYDSKKKKEICKNVTWSYLPAESGLSAIFYLDQTAKP